MLQNIWNGMIYSKDEMKLGLTSQATLVGPLTHYNFTQGNGYVCSFAEPDSKESLTLATTETSRTITG